MLADTEGTAPAVFVGSVLLSPTSIVFPFFGALVLPVEGGGENENDVGTSGTGVVSVVERTANGWTGCDDSRPAPTEEE